MELLIELLPKFLETGIVGGVALVFLWLFLKTRKDLDKSHKMHLEDIKSAIDSLDKIEQTLAIIGIENSSALEILKSQLSQVQGSLAELFRSSHDLNHGLSEVSLLSERLEIYRKQLDDIQEKLANVKRSE